MASHTEHSGRHTFSDWVQLRGVRHDGLLGTSGDHHSGRDVRVGIFLAPACSAEQTPGDDLIHYFVGSAADPQYPGVSVMPLDLRFTHVAKATV